MTSHKFVFHGIDRVTSILLCNAMFASIFSSKNAGKRKYFSISSSRVSKYKLYTNMVNSGNNLYTNSLFGQYLKILTSIKRIALASSGQYFLISVNILRYCPHKQLVQGQSKFNDFKYCFLLKTSRVITFRKADLHKNGEFQTLMKE